MSIILQPASLVYNVSKSKSIEDLVEATLDNPEHIARTTVMDVCKRYGDYLYSKQEYDASQKQYNRTIGHLQPSYVIRKFLDAQRIHNLTGYLQALHGGGLANANHTTLLLNCYAKLNDLESLNAFIESSDSFDIDTAISVCRTAGFYPQALGIASKFEQHDWYIKIQIEDLTVYDEAISFLIDLPSELQKAILIKYGQQLVSHRPGRMTKVLLDQILESELQLSEIVSFYISRPEFCVLFLEGYLLKKHGIDLDKNISISTVADEADRQMALDILIDLELSLRQAGKPLPNQPLNWDAKILQILGSDISKFDIENALFLCQQYGFDDGLLALYEKLNLYDQFLGKVKDFDTMIEICKKYGKHAKLWYIAFEYCAKTADSSKESPQLCQILEEISSRNLMTEIEIIDMMASCNISLGNVRPYLERKMDQSLQVVEKADKSISSYEAECARLEKDILEIENRPILFQNTKCDLCKQNLELPAMHFLCRHSFHSKYISTF